EGKGRIEDLARLDDVARKIEGRTICALGDAAAMPVRSFIKHFRSEFEYYVEHGSSMAESLPGKAA
ncbi:MAG: NADH-ubiquinone oxidoreductase-F iron-sulfur binding region domain-containing protein, partial [Gammaproteobacteria bacterium]